MTCSNNLIASTGSEGKKPPKTKKWVSYQDSIFSGISEDDLYKKLEGVAPVPEITSGKVRDIINLGSRLLIVVSDRVSAFDQVLTTIPFKGQVLNQLSVFWFEKTRDIVANHLVRETSPRSMLVQRCSVLPVEVVVRGYLAGSAWRDYKRQQSISGKILPKGMNFCEKFSEPLITPSTKAEKGEHDRPISEAEIISAGLVQHKLWKQIETVSLKLYQCGVEHAADQGLILVDTKYEFGVVENELVLVDEIHTPDSSRYWYKDSYEERFADGLAQRELDKEFLRGWLIKKGYMGDGIPPEIPEVIRTELSKRYLKIYRMINGKELVPVFSSIKEEIEKLVEIISVESVR